MKFNRRTFATILFALGAILSGAYLVGSLLLIADGRFGQGSRPCRGVMVTIRGGDNAFVSAADVIAELGVEGSHAQGRLLRDIAPERLRNRLSAVDKVEDVEVTVTTDDYISIIVTPLIPVARVFDMDQSYYVNRDGKRMSADRRYHVDVPLIRGHFPSDDSTALPLTDLLPLVRFIEKDPTLRRLVTMIDVHSPEDIFIIPAIKGHVVNFGTPSAPEDKFARLQRFYSQVMPVKGWNYYDTLSVKWGGQLVARRRVKQRHVEQTLEEDDFDDTNIASMLAAEGVAPGQTKPGRKANNERPIPDAQPMPNIPQNNTTTP